MVDTRIAELKRDQEAIQAVVGSLVDRLEAVTLQIKCLQEQNSKNWEGVQLQLRAMGNAMSGREGNGKDRDQSEASRGTTPMKTCVVSGLSKEEQGNSYPKLKFPDFDGTNLEDWVYRCERYFELELTPGSKKVCLASVYMYGEAFQWHYAFIRNRGRSDLLLWAEYAEALTKQFGKDVGDKPMGRVELPKEFYISPFINGLKEKSEQESKSGPLSHSEGSGDGGGHRYKGKRGSSRAERKKKERRRRKKEINRKRCESKIKRRRRNREGSRRSTRKRKRRRKQSDEGDRLLKEMELTDRFNLMPAMRVLYRRIVAMFVSGFWSKMKPKQVRDSVRRSFPSYGDDRATLGEKSYVKLVDGLSNQNSDDLVSDVMSKFQNLGLNLSFDAGPVSEEQKNQVIATVINQLRYIESQVLGRKEWVQQRAMQAARTVSNGVYLLPFDKEPVLAVVGPSIVVYVGSGDTIIKLSEPDQSSQVESSSVQGNPSTCTRISGLIMPSAELIAATSVEFIEAQVEFKDAQVGFALPIMVAEDESAKEAERLEGVTRIIGADTDNPYDVWRVNRKIFAESVKKGYSKTSLLVQSNQCSHPEAHRSFTKLNKAIKDVQNLDKRKALDDEIIAKGIGSIFYQKKLERDTCNCIKICMKKAMVQQPRLHMGMASVDLAGVIATIKATDGKLVDQTLLFLGAREAGTGIVELIALEMSKQTQESVKETSEKIWLVDPQGLIVSSRMESLQHFKEPWAHEHELIKTLRGSINEIMPTDLLGASGGGRSFTEGVKPQPYKQTSGAPRLNQKLASSFYGSYKILEKMGTIGYSENRKPTTILHRKVVNRGSRTTTKIRTLDNDSTEGETTWKYFSVFLQKFFCSEQWVNRGSRVAMKVLIRWINSNEGDETGELLDDLMQKSWECTLEDKCSLKKGDLMQGIVTVRDKEGAGPSKRRMGCQQDRRRRGRNTWAINGGEGSTPLRCCCRCQVVRQLVCLGKQYKSL